VTCFAERGEKTLSERNWASSAYRKGQAVKAGEEQAGVGKKGSREAQKRGEGWNRCPPMPGAGRQSGTDGGVELKSAKKRSRAGDRRLKKKTKRTGKQRPKDTSCRIGWEERAVEKSRKVFKIHGSTRGARIKKEREYIPITSWVKIRKGVTWGSQER